MHLAYQKQEETDQDLVVMIAIQAFKQVISKLKSKTFFKQPIAYFSGIQNKIFEEVFIKE